MKKKICANVLLDIIQCRGYLTINKQLLKLNEEKQKTIEIVKSFVVVCAFTAYLSIMLQQEVDTESFKVSSVSSDGELSTCMADITNEVTDSHEKNEGCSRNATELIKTEKLEETNKIKNNFLHNETVEVNTVAKNASEDNFIITQIEPLSNALDKTSDNFNVNSENQNNIEIGKLFESGKQDLTILTNNLDYHCKLETVRPTGEDDVSVHQDEVSHFEKSELGSMTTTNSLPVNNIMEEENKQNNNNESVSLIDACSSSIESDSKSTEKLNLKSDVAENIKISDSQILSNYPATAISNEKHINHSEGLEHTKNLSDEAMDLKTPEKESSRIQPTSLKSVLRKSGTPSSKKGLRVSFSDSQNIFIEPEPSAAMTLFLGQGFELHLSDLCQWEAALQFPTSHSDPFEGSWEDMSNSLTQTDTEADENIIQGVSESNLSNSDSFQEISNDKSKEEKSATCPELTEANLRHHEQLLDFKSDQSTESDTETSSSQDTMILMTTEESRRNQEHIEESQRKYEMQQQGSSSSSSHESDETSTKTVMRSNSAVRRCLERTALRRSLTRCSEARLRLQEVSKREDSGSSIEEKLRLLTQELETDAQKGLEENCEVQNKAKDSLPCLDLHEVQTLLTRHCSLNDMYSFQNDVNVPCDIREWKLHSYLEDCQPEKFKSKTSNSRSYMTNISDSLSEVTSRKPSSSGANSHSVPSQATFSVNDSDELAQFVQQDKDRIDRIRRRYSTDNEDYVSLGFSRRPSVRGIKPKFGSTNQILQQLQQQLQPPSLARSPGSHVTWPYMNVNDSSVPDNSIYSLHLPSSAQENKKFNYLSSIRPHSVIGNYSSSPNMSFDGNFNNSDVNTNYNISEYRNSTCHDMEPFHASNQSNLRLLNSDPSTKTYPLSRTKRRKERFQTNCSVSPSSSYTASSLPEHHPSPPPYIPPPNPSSISVRTCERGTPEGASSSPKVSSDSLYILSSNITAAPEKQTKDGLVYFALDV